jgi:hypothetical protein
MKLAKYPTLMKAATIIAHDMGAINRLEEFDPASIEIPNGTVTEMTLVEHCLILLPEPALEIVCTGEEKEARQILRIAVGDYRAGSVHGILNAIGEVI